MLEILGKIGFDWEVALANLVNFIIIFFVLKKFAFKPIKKVIDERQSKIDKGLEDAKKAETELLMAEEIRSKKVEDAKLEANIIVGSAQKKGDEIISKSKEDGEITKASIIADGEKQLAQKNEKARSELENEQAHLIVDGIEKILKKNFTESDQNDYIKKVLAG